MYPPLNLPPANLKIQGTYIWDPLRKKYLKNTPEEWVRQHFIAYLLDHLNYPAGRMVSEYTVDYDGMKKRCDIAIFNSELKVDVIVECKAPHIELNEDTFYQIAKYSRVLQASLLILTNGMNHYCAFIDKKGNELKYLREIPTSEELIVLLSN
ncbi:MAG: type I restriction enzyme HsdR N-terminal domain-containing protein [Crocinitomicaceae bacterium]|nr:type I restriction enzyme HsdR N-terminal domain-containing protein [Crocinitomicaceae bacterium]